MIYNNGTITMHKSHSGKETKNMIYEMKNEAFLVMTD